MLRSFHSVVPAKAGMEAEFTDVRNARLDSRLRGNDNRGGRYFLRLLWVLGALAASPAAATEWVHCSDTGGAASFDYLAGDGLGVLSISALTVTAGEKVWASDPANGPGDPVSVGQAFEDENSVRIDAMDKDFEKFAELRLFKASEGDSYVTAGTLRIKGMGAWAVACEGP